MLPLAEDLSQQGLNVLGAKAGRMYGTGEGLGYGAGLILSGVRYAQFDPESRRFQAVRGAVLVLTHECDIDKENQKLLNEQFAFVPLILMTAVADAFICTNNHQKALGFIGEVAGGGVNRMLYFPPMHQYATADGLELGAIINWNAVNNTYLSQLTDAEAKVECALSEYGLECADVGFRAHFLRPKADQLARL